MLCHSAHLTYSNDIDKGRFPRVLKADESQLHLLLPKEALEPLDYSVQESQHLEPLLDLSRLSDGVKAVADIFKRLCAH